jgi:anti-sigma-K factor RskA
VDQPTPSLPNSASQPRAGAALSRSTLAWLIATIVTSVAVSALAASFVATRYEARLGVMARQLSAAHDEIRRAEAALRTEPGDERAVIELLLDPATRVFTLRAPGPSPALSGRIVWRDARGGRLLVAGLPEPPRGHVYAIWIVVSGKARFAGTVAHGPGHASQAFTPAPEQGSAGGFLVTLEASGDHAAPTGSVVLVSE